MKVVSLTELREYVNGVQCALNAVVGFLAEENAIIADVPVPAPIKKVRKARKKVDKGWTQGMAPPEPPKSSGRPKGSKNKDKTPFGEPKLRPGETPV